MGIFNFRSIKEAAGNVFRKSHSKKQKDAGCDGVTLLSYESAGVQLRKGPIGENGRGGSGDESRPFSRYTPDAYLQGNNKRNPLYRNSLLGSASLDGSDLNQGLAAAAQPDQEEADLGYGFGRSLSPAAADGGGRKSSEFDGFASAGYGFDASPAAPEDTPRGSTPPPEPVADADAAGPASSQIPCRCSSHGESTAAFDDEEAKRLAARAEQLAKISRRRSIRKSEEERELYSALAIIDNLSEV